MLSVTPVDLHRLSCEGPVTLIDVRGPAEFGAVHATGAVNLPMAELLAPGRLAHLSPEGPTYVICKSGGRSRMAIQTLEAMGFGNLFNVTGGTDAWIAAGLPVQGDLARVG